MSTMMYTKAASNNHVLLQNPKYDIKRQMYNDQINFIPGADQSTIETMKLVKQLKTSTAVSLNIIKNKIFQIYQDKVKMS